MKENNIYDDHKEDLNLPLSARINPFVVPDAYFDESAATLYSLINIAKAAPAQDAGFAVPEAYFSDAQQTITRIVNLQAHTQALENSLPADYFDTLSEKIINQVRLDKYKLPDAAEMSAPEGYFEGLTHTIEARLYAEKLRDTVDNDGFEVPSGYFEQLSTKLLTQTQQQDAMHHQEDRSADATPIRTLRSHSWIRYASAACVAAVLSIGSYMAVTQNNTSDEEPMTLARISEDEIISYLASSTDSDDLLYYTEYIYQPESASAVGHQVEDKDIEEYLNYML